MILEDSVRFSLEYFFLNSACSLEILETLRISVIDREQLRSQQHLLHNHDEQEFTRALSDFRVI